MNILIVSQVFWPDSSSLSQHLLDLAEALVIKGHKVKVFSSCNGYEDPQIIFPAKESHKGIDITRLKQTKFGKKSKLGRALNFLTFNLCLLYKLLHLKKGDYDLIMGTTSPPLSLFFNSLAAALKKCCFCHWAMDLQPELSIEAGYLSKHSPFAFALCALNDYCLKRADKIIVLDNYMAEYIERKEVSSTKICVIPVWPVLERSYDGFKQNNPFRHEHNMTGKIVIMYSGNHAVVHPLDTLLETIKQLKDDPRFLFVFIGGGVRKDEVTRFKSSHDLKNILQLPYQKREDMAFSLSAADLHVVIHGNGCTGYTHPNKIYGAMFVARPILYIGPSPSHITDILDQCPGNLSVKHGQSGKLTTLLRAFAETDNHSKDRIGKRNSKFVITYLNRDVLIAKIISVLESIVRGASA